MCLRVVSTPLKRRVRRRKQLNLNFAILLMRSTYEAVDALDFIPMDKFQIKFWHGLPKHFVALQ